MSAGTANAEGSAFEPPFPIPESWVWTNLGNVLLSLHTGLNPRRFFKLNTADAQNYYVTIRELKNGRIVFSPRTDRINDLAMGLCNRRSKLEKGDVLFGGTGTIGATALVSETPLNWNIKEGVYALKPIQELLFPKYLLCLLQEQTIQKSYFARAVGGTVLSVPMKEMFSIEIPLPPLPEQRRIVSRFEELSSLSDSIDEDAAAFGTLARTAKSRILDLAIRGALVPQDSTDEPASVLLDRIRSTADKPPCPNKKSESFESPFPIPDTWEWTTIREINEYERKTLQPDPGSEEIFELYSVPVFESGLPEFVKGTEISSPKQVVRKGDVLVCKINPRINRVWNVAGHTDSRLLASSEWIVVRAKDIVSGYLKIVFQSPYFRAKLLTNVSGVGGSLMRAQAGFVMDYPFPIPPLAEQRRIVAKVEELFSAIDAMATK